MATDKTEQIRDDLREGGVDPFLIAAEAVERSERLMAQIKRLEKVLSQVPGLSTHEPRNSDLFQLH